MFNILDEYIPCWYELSWNPKIPAIILRIHKDFIKNFIRDGGAVSYKASIIKGLKRELKVFKYLHHFEDNFEKNIGFEGVFRRLGENGEFIEFAVDIPVIKKESKDVCRNCGGSGKDKYEGDKCLFCNGTGKKPGINWRMAYCISASFTILLTLLSTQKDKTNCELPQLFEINTITHEDTHGGSLNGQFSVPLVNWLKRFNHSREISEIKDTMIKTYGHMFSLSNCFDHTEFKIQLSSEKSGWIVLCCPGSACSIFPEGFRDSKKGYKFSCNNVDSPAQQLTLLSGLAALHDLARKEIKSY